MQKQWSIFVNNITVGGICGDIRRYHPSNSYVLRSRGRGCGSSEAGRPSTESHADERHRCREWTLRGSGEPRVEYLHETIQNWWKKQAFNVKSEQVMLYEKVRYNSLWRVAMSIIITYSTRRQKYFYIVCRIAQSGRGVFEGLNGGVYW